MANRNRKNRAKPVRRDKRRKLLEPLKGSPHIRVVVDQEFIDDAIKSNAYRCLVVRAIQDKYPKYVHVTVDLQTIRFSDPERGVRYVYLTPRIVQAALVLFDQGKKMRPFKFDLRGAHTVSMKRINRQKGVSVQVRLNLGRKRILPQSATRNGVIDIVGGRAAPRHPSSRGIRRFGLRQFTQEDLNDVSATRRFRPTS